MPLYEYRCTACGDTFEVLQRMSARPLRTCKRCSGKLEKLISRASFMLKGGGWYSEGYVKRPKGARAEPRKVGKDPSKGSSSSQSAAPATA